MRSTLGGAGDGVSGQRVCRIPGPGRRSASFRSWAAGSPPGADNNKARGSRLVGIHLAREHLTWPEAEAEVNKGFKQEHDLNGVIYMVIYLA